MPYYFYKGKPCQVELQSNLSSILSTRSSKRKKTLPTRYVDDNYKNLMLNDIPSEELNNALEEEVESWDGESSITSNSSEEEEEFDKENLDSSKE